MLRSFLQLRFWVIWIACQAAGGAIFYLPGIVPISEIYVALLSVALTAVGLVAHMLAQPPAGTIWATIRGHLDSFWLGTSGGVRPKHVVMSGAVLAVALPLLYRLEGVRTTSYQDIVGVWTYCVGETKGAGPNQHYTMAQCDAKLHQRLQQDFYPEVVAAIPATPTLPPKTQAALVSLWYNEGDGTMHNSSVARAGRAGRYHDMCNAFMNFQRPPQLHGRRVYERKLCLQGLDEAGIRG